jgi:transcriptional regulator with XRE-family HTH domain
MGANASGTPIDLKRLREARGLSQQQLAAAADCSLSMVRMLEAGYRPQPSTVLDRVLEVLDIDQTSGRSSRDA